MSFGTVLSPSNSSGGPSGISPSSQSDLPGGMGGGASTSGGVFPIGANNSFCNLSTNIQPSDATRNLESSRYLES